MSPSRLRAGSIFPLLIGATGSPSTKTTRLVTVTAMACLALRVVVDDGSIMFWSWLTSRADEVKVLSKNTRMMVIMSIMGVMFRLVISWGSDSLRA